MKLKICGMTRQEDLRLADALGFDYCGFIFHPDSPRHVSAARAAGLESGRMKRVGVFVKQNSAEILAIMKEARLDLAQLHGDQPEETARAVGPERVIRVMWPERFAGRKEMENAAASLACAWYLLDAGRGGGGAGRGIKAGFLQDLILPKPWLLAGGLAPENLDAVLAKICPDGLDFNSGLESAPGIKDGGKMRKVVNAVKGRKA